MILWEKYIHYNEFDKYEKCEQVTYPNMMELFENLGVEMETSNMSFSVSLDKGRGYEWGTRHGLSTLFAQKKNIFNPFFLKMFREIIKFNDDVIK